MHQCVLMVSYLQWYWCCCSHHRKQPCWRFPPVFLRFMLHVDILANQACYVVLPLSECDGWLGPDVVSPSSSPKDCGRSTGAEETPCSEQRSITETVINGSMKETVSLTVDAKTETAVFKRFACHIYTLYCYILLLTYWTPERTFP